MPSGPEILFLSKEDIDALVLSLQEIMDVIELGLKAHSEKKVVMPSKDHLSIEEPGRHFNILKGYVMPPSTWRASRSSQNRRGLTTDAPMICNVWPAEGTDRAEGGSG